MLIHQSHTRAVVGARGSDGTMRVEDSTLAAPLLSKGHLLAPLDADVEAAVHVVVIQRRFAVEGLPRRHLPLQPVLSLPPGVNVRDNWVQLRALTKPRRPRGTTHRANSQPQRHHRHRSGPRHTASHHDRPIVGAQSRPTMAQRPDDTGPYAPCPGISLSGCEPALLPRYSYSYRYPYRGTHRYPLVVPDFSCTPPKTGKRKHLLVVPRDERCACAKNKT